MRPPPHQPSLLALWPWTEGVPLGRSHGVDGVGRELARAGQGHPLTPSMPGPPQDPCKATCPILLKWAVGGGSAHAVPQPRAHAAERDTGAVGTNLLGVASRGALEARGAGSPGAWAQVSAPTRPGALAGTSVQTLAARARAWWSRVDGAWHPAGNARERQRQDASLAWVGGGAGHRRRARRSVTGRTAARRPSWGGDGGNREGWRQWARHRVAGRRARPTASMLLPSPGGWGPQATAGGRAAGLRPTRPPPCARR